MIRINLLPPELRKKKRAPLVDRYFIYIILAIGIEIMALFFVNVWQNSEIDRLETQLAQIRAEITKYKAQIRLVNELSALKDNIQSRMDALRNLEQQRPIWINTFSNLSKILPEFVWLKSFTETNEK